MRREVGLALPGTAPRAGTDAPPPAPSRCVERRTTAHSAAVPQGRSGPRTPAPPRVLSHARTRAPPPTRAWSPTHTAGAPLPADPRRTMYAATEAIGMMASLTSFVILLPHAVRIWKYRNDPAELRGIAMGSQVIGLAGTFLWGAYAILTEQVWVGAPHLVNGPITVATIVVLRRVRRQVARPVARLELPRVLPRAEAPVRELVD